MNTALALGIALALAAAGSARIARADGWWGGGDGDDGCEGCGCNEFNGCEKNPDGSWSCADDARAARDSKRVGTGLMMFAFVGYRISRKRRPR
jgi:hypothetical protein